MTHKAIPVGDAVHRHNRFPGINSARILTPAILILAAMLRFWQLDFHSFWFDEAVSLQWATYDLAFIWEKTFPLVEEKHPPAYYALLHFWLKLLEPLELARSDAAIRTLGAALGVFTVWSTMTVATHISGRSTGALTGLLVALSPLLIWYSQELRMFQPATTGSTLAALAMVTAWQTSAPWRRMGWWLLMGLGLLFALYSYLFSAFIMPAAGLSLLLLYRAYPRPRYLAEGIATLALVTLLFLPLAQNAWGVNAAESTPGQAFANFWDNHRRLLDTFTLWRVRWPDWLTASLFALWSVAILAGLWPRRPHTEAKQFAPTPARQLDSWWLWLWLLVPLFIANLLLSRSGSIFNEDRYLLFLAPFALWTLARGLIVLVQWHRLAGALLIALTLVAFGAAMPQVWSTENYRENWRAAAQYIIDYGRAHPNLTAAGVAHIDYTNLPLQWYLRQAYTHDELPVFFPYGGWVDPQNPETSVAPYIRGIEDLGVDTLWLTQAHTQHVDPSGAVEAWIQETYPIVTELYPTGIKLTGHILQTETATLPVASTLDETADQTGDTSESEPTELLPGLLLHRCTVTFPTVNARDNVYHPPSGWVHIQSWWSVTDAVDFSADLRLAARVLGPDAIWGESLPRPADTFMLNPPHTWTAGAFVRAETDINLNPVMPPGDYVVEIQLLGATETVTAPCGSVQIR